MTVFEQIIALLDNEKIPYTLTEHEPVRTSDDAAKNRGVGKEFGAKSMVIKAKDTYVLCVLPADKKIDWKKVKQLLNVKEIRFATEEEAEEITHVKMGSVPPFGNLLNIPTYYDKSILEIDEIFFNPGSVTHSIQMKADDLVRAVNPTLVDIL